MKKWIASGLFLAAQTFAITGGPTMPEYTQFEEVTATNLVDPNSGNFTYVVPLLEVPTPEGSYPLALSYHSGVRYNQEATWVGLGWSLNAGSINRILRGVPDDYFNSVVATRNISSASGGTFNVNIGYGPYGLSMAWDMNTGECIGVTPSLTYSMSTAMGFGISVGPQITLTPAGVSVGIGVGLPLGQVNLSLYNSDKNASTGVGFTPSMGGVSVSHSSGSQVGVGAGGGVTNYSSEGVGVTVYGVSVYVGVSNWRWDLNEAIVDYMCGYLFQDGRGVGFKDRFEDPRPNARDAIPFVIPEGSNAPYSNPRQRFERSKMGKALFPSSDFYLVAANGMSGSFQPYVQPGAAIPIINDAAGKNNQGWNIDGGASLDQISFRMDGDQGYNLLHTDPAAPDGNQIAPDEYIWPISEKSAPRKLHKQYGAYQIKPCFRTTDDGTAVTNTLVGFVIVNGDGIQYEYKQPVYTLYQGDYAFKDANYAPVAERMAKSNPERYATSWLITAVKGADYIPSNSADNITAVPFPGDRGHWVKFSYTSPVLVNWSTPFKGNTPPDNGSSGFYNREYGIREQVYLSSIETQTHKAYFDLVDRLDVPTSKNNPVNYTGTGDPAGFMSSKDAARTEDGLIARSYTDYWGSVLIPPNPTGGFPVYLGKTSMAISTVYSASFNLIYPSAWGQKIIDYRTAHNCRDVQGHLATCADEKLLGFHFKYDWIDDCLGCGDNNWKYGSDHLSFTGASSDDHVNGNTVKFNVTCPDVSVSNAETKIKCIFDVSSVTSLQNIQVYSAFLNWPEMEAQGLLTYSKPKALAGIRLTEKATKVTTKEIRFGYDYSQCNNVPNHPGLAVLASPNDDVFINDDANHTKGKLTLRRIRIYGTGGKASGSMLPEYSFRYQGEMDDMTTTAFPNPYNPDYDASASGLFKTDVWGMYSPRSSSSSHGVNQSNTPTPAAGAPYNGGDQVGVCWNLAKITVPTGGAISMDYRRDDYYYAGMVKDLVVGNNIIFPDIYDVDITQSSTSVVNFDKFYSLKVMPTTSTTNYSTFSVLDLYKNTPSSNKLPKSALGPDGKDDFEIVPALNNTPVDLTNGDMVLVAYKMEQNPNLTTSTWQTKFVGISNIALVKRTEASGATAKRVRLYPLVQTLSSTDKRFFIYNHIHVAPSTASAEAFYRFSYYLIPVRGPNGRKFYGGDVAVKSLKTDNGFGNAVTRNYSYSVPYRLNAKGTTLPLGPELMSAGATWKMPDLPVKDRSERFISGASNIFSALHFDPWPYWCTDVHGTPATSACENVSPPKYATKNILTDFLDKVYKTDDRVGAFYYPDPGITYARAKETIGDGKMGSTEYQFYNLAYPFLADNGVAFNPPASATTASAATTAPWVFNDWVSTTATVAGVASDKVEGDVLALNGKMMRRFEYNSTGTIVTRNENSYNLPSNAGANSGYGNVNIYSNSDDAPVGRPLGFVQQTMGYSTTAGTKNYFTMLTPNAFLKEESETKDAVTTKIAYDGFEARTGVPLVTINRNSDDRGYALYKSPKYWTDVSVRYLNMLTQIEEERKYTLDPGYSFDRTYTWAIVSATHHLWERFAGTNYFKTNTYDWMAKIYDDGSDRTFTPFAGADDPNWRPQGLRATNYNGYSYAIERVNDATGIYSSEYTGYGNNLVIGSVDDSRWATSSIYSCDYMLPGSGPFANTLDRGTGWWRNSTSLVTLNSAIKHFGTKALYLTAGGQILNGDIPIDPMHKKITVDAFIYANTGNVRMTVQPIDDNIYRNPVGASMNKTASGASWKPYSVQIDLNQDQYANAKNLLVTITALDVSSGFVDDIRVHPSESLVKTYYYDPATYKLITSVDENRNAKRAIYDSQGRLTAIKNNAGQTVSQATYTNYTK